MKRALVVIAVLACAAGFASEKYEYDPAGRITRVTYTDGSSISYTYDAAGNVLNQTAIGVTAPILPTLPGAPRSCGCNAGGLGMFALLALSGVGRRFSKRLGH